MKIPKLNDFCEVMYDGRMCVAVVSRVDSTSRTFNAVTSFGGKMHNIPFEKFKPSPSVANIIINTLNDQYGLDLKTVDAMDMTNTVDDILKNKAWMLSVERYADPDE